MFCRIMAVTSCSFLCLQTLLRLNIQGKYASHKLRRFYSKLKSNVESSNKLRNGPGLDYFMCINQQNARQTTPRTVQESEPVPYLSDNIFHGMERKGMNQVNNCK